ncbi:zinc ribbon domain-containing protein YjdM [Rubritalea tangerina]|uniref:Zinc ribbon domain-containing protein YjdM n=1 Tax=Rubritalea tangerina TaxID=430798 RepID=A0ABW4ZBW5_9BACT
MSNITCPLCTMDDVAEHKQIFECMVCGHEWPKPSPTDEDAEETGPRVVKDAFGNTLQDGDIVQMIKDKKLTGTSKVLKCGTKSKPIRIQEHGDHEISCKMDGFSIGLKAKFVKKVNP